MMKRHGLAPLYAALAFAGCSDSDDHDFDTSYVDQDVAVAGRWALPASVHTVAQTQSVRYDGPPPWDGGAHCSGTFLAGTRTVGDYLRAQFGGVSSYGGYACRQNTANAAETSVHGTGRAIDVFIPMAGSDADNTAGDPVANWLITHAERIGIQLVIWDHSVWQASLSGEKLQPYGGPVPHIDHIHVELTVAAANQQTAWFHDGGPSQPPDGSAAPDWYAFTGDWDGNGTKTPGFYNVKTHRWLLSNHNSGGSVDHDFGWGGDGFLPIVGDWNGDGIDTPGLYNPTTHVWNLSNHNTGGGVDITFGWGGGNQVPLAGDWNGDGIDTPGLFDPATRTWTLSNHNSGGGFDAKFGWGGANLIPIIGDWNGDGVDSVGLYNRTTHIWTLSNVNASHGIDAQFGWGGGDRLPLVGDWNGDGTDTPGQFAGETRTFTQTNFNAGSGIAAEFGWGPVGNYTVLGAN